MAESGTRPPRSPAQRVQRAAHDADAGQTHFCMAELRDGKVALTEIGGSVETVSAGRVTKGVGQAIGRALRVERDTALPDHLASLVDRLQAGPLGRTSLKTHRVA